MRNLETAFQIYKGGATGCQAAIGSPGRSRGAVEPRSGVEPRKHSTDYEVDKGLAGGGAAPAPFVAACHLYFNAAADFQKGIGAHGKEIMGDIPNYTDLAPQIQVSEIVVA